MIARFRESWKNPASRGFIMLATLQVTYGVANSLSNGIITNYFENVLHFGGPQFGYMTAVRETGGLLLILLMALLYRVSLQWLTAGAMLLLAIGYGFLGTAHSFATIVPWILISSFGMHTILQTQYSLGMTLTPQERSGHTLGRLTGFGQAGTFAALIGVFFIFHFHLLSYEYTFMVAGIFGLLGAIAIFRFPHLYDGELRKVAPKRGRMVWRKDYKYFYWLNLLDGVRQQIFFSFGLWVLVDRFKLTVAGLSLILMTVTFVTIFSSSYVGRLIDRIGERRVLQAINVGYIFALGGYALANNVYLACVFYVLYSFVAIFSSIGASVYLRKIAVPQEVAPSLAMGITILHATAVVVPVAAGFILHFVGYQIPFFIACGVALVTVFVTRRLDPLAQRTAARVALDEARSAPKTDTDLAVIDSQTTL
jgi:predicted MFS family arabinose efflux permease